MMQCSSAAAQIQYSRHRIFFGFEDEIAGGQSLAALSSKGAKKLPRVTVIDKA
jgi:hypothetical protein